MALSTIHYEYVALSHSIRALLPLKILIKEVIDNLGIDIEKLKFVSSSTIYEDNNGAIVVAPLLSSYIVELETNLSFSISIPKLSITSLIRLFKGSNALTE